MRAALVLALAAVSCFRPEARSGAPCAEGDVCPSGLVCRGGLCLAPGDDPVDGAAAVDITWGGSVSGSRDAVMLSEVTTSAAISGDAGDLYLAVVSIKPSRPVTGIAGLGATWTPIREQCGGRNTARLAMFWARAEAATTGAVTASLNSGTTFLGSAVITVHRYTGTDPTAPIGNASWANTNGRDGDPACAGGIDTSSYAWSTLDTSAPRSIVFAGTHTARFTHMPGAEFVEREDLKSADTSESAGLAIEERLVELPARDVLVTGGYSGSPDWSAIAVELRD